jgi:hypothetical protein
MGDDQDGPVARVPPRLPARRSAAGASTSNTTLGIVLLNDPTALDEAVAAGRSKIDVRPLIARR